MHVLMVLILAGTFGACWGHSHEDLERLMKYLFDESQYNREIKPINNQTRQMVINVTWGLYELDNLDVTNRLMEMMSYFTVSWTDEFLVWNPADFGGIQVISVSYDKIWNPGIAQKGGGKTGSIINEAFARAFVSPNGLVFLMTGGTYATKCEIDTTYYPFDAHVCSYTFFSFRHPAHEMTLNAPGNEIHQELYVEHDAWDIKDTEVVSDVLNIQGSNLSYMRNSVTVRRRPMFVFVNRYCPLMFMTILNSITSLIPPDTGERFSYAVTMYLSFVFMTIALVDEFPQNALHISLSSYGVLVIEIVNTSSIIWTVLMVRMSAWKVDKKPIPENLLKLVLWSQRKRKISPNDDDSIDEKTEEWVVEELDQKPCDVIDKPEIDHNTSHDSHDVTWIDVAWFLDKVYFVVMVSLVMIVMLTIIGYWLVKY